jgi:hypothetical protein
VGQLEKARSREGNQEDVPDFEQWRADLATVWHRFASMVQGIESTIALESQMRTACVLNTLEDELGMKLLLSTTAAPAASSTAARHATRKVRIIDPPEFLDAS